MQNLIRYFIQRPLVGNLFMFSTILCALALWPKIGKEQMPDLTMNWVRIMVSYSGASAEDVELFITKPIEEKLKGVTGLDEVSSTSGSGSSTFNIFFEPSTTNLPEKLQEVKDAIDSVDFPRDAEQPVYRQFKSSERAIIDLAIFNRKHELLGVKERYELQEMALNFKNRLLSLREISGLEASGYLRPELQIKFDSEKLRKFEISVQQVIEQIQQQHVRTPVGSLNDKQESEVTLISELDDIEPLENVIITSGFEGQKIRLKEIAKIEKGFEKARSIVKIQGHEGVIFNVQKSTSVDILSAQEALLRFIHEFKRNNPDSDFSIILLDDESYEIRNRLGLIGSNGLMGFILILIILFIFLDLKAGIWVAMGIPFSLALTLIITLLMGETVNNMTLAAVIIVLGIVVDDAIIVAENITRRKETGIEMEENAVRKTSSIMIPILASVLTTCAAFVPLYFFTGRFGLFVKSIPSIIFIMLLASLIESMIILPGHMIHDLPGEKFFRRFFNYKKKVADFRYKYNQSAEKHFAIFLERVLPWRGLVLLSFVAILIGSGLIYKANLKYVMFPREEAVSFTVKAVGPKTVNRKEMALLVGKVERVFLDNPLGIVTSVRTHIGQGRRGGEVKENEANLRVELVPYSQREMGLDDAIAEWGKITSQMKEFKSIRFLKDRFGSESGSAIVIEVQENSDSVRKKVVSVLEKKLKSLPILTDIEIESPVLKDEFRLHIIEDEVSRMNIGFNQLSSVLRTYVQGHVLYTLNSGEEEVDVRLMGSGHTKDEISSIMELRVANRENYLVPIKGLVEVEKGRRPANIQRTNFKRAVKVYADIAPSANATPLEAAEILESEVFPEVLRNNSSTTLQFRGEIEDSRESQSDFSFAIYLVMALIYLLLVLLFNSIWTPFLIASIIPFGVAGVILTLYVHGMSQYGFFAVVGTLGLIGIVINDSIVLIDKLKENYTFPAEKKTAFAQIAAITSGRLRAIILTTLTTFIGLIPTAYGWGGHDSMLAEMMIVMSWGLAFATSITLLLVPCLYSYYVQFEGLFKREKN